MGSDDVAMVTAALTSYGALIGFFLVPAVIMSLATRLTVGARVDAWLDGPCPDCGASSGEDCHYACSTFWT